MASGPNSSQGGKPGGLSQKPASRNCFGHDSIPSSGSAEKCLVIFIVRLSGNLRKLIFWLFCNKIDEYWLLFGYFVIPMCFKLYLFLTLSRRGFN